MLRSVEFTRGGHRYRAEVRPMPGGPEEFAYGAWFVMVDDGLPRRVFEAHPDDEDNADFQHRLMVAAWLADGWNRRSGADRRRAARPGAVERRQLTPL